MKQLEVFKFILSSKQRKRLKVNMLHFRITKIMFVFYAQQLKRLGEFLLLSLLQFSR